MKMTRQDLGVFLKKELAEGYDVVRIARAAFQIYQTQGQDLSEDLAEVLLQLTAMEDGPEFEFSELELAELSQNFRGNLG